ncbi:MAG: PAS domain S-box protein, partial [Bacteroidales bacterium]|nr:PAS domain S-box protein [Bacteroidales bacterium]
MKVVANDRMKWKLPLLLGFLAVVFLYLAYAFYEHERDTAQQKKRYELEAISSLKAAQVLQWRQERMSEAEYFSTGDVFRPMIERIVNGDQVVAQTYRERLMRIMTNNRYHNIMLLDTRGNLAFAVYPTAHGVDDLTKDMALESVKADTVRIRDFFYCENCKRLMYQLMAPVLDLNGKPVATLILDINPSDYIFPYIQTWPLQSQTAENYLIRVLGDSVEFLSPLRFAEIRSMAIADLPFAEVNSISSAIRSTSGSAEGYDYRGVSVLSYWQSIEGTSWVLMSEVDTREVYSTLRLLSFLTAGLVLVLLIAMSLVLVWYHQRRKKRLFEALYLQTARLHEAQEEFSAIIYSIGDGVITTDKEGRVKRMNPIAEKWTGWSESEAVGMDVESCFPIFNETDGSVMGNPIRKVLLDGSIQHLANHTVLVNRRGASVPIADSAAPIKDKEGTLLGTVLVFRTQQEERLRRQLLEFRLTIQDFFQTHDFQDALRFGLESVAHFFKAEQLVYESSEGRRCLNEGMAIPPQIDRILSNGIRDGLMVNESISGWMIVPVIKNERAVALVGFCRIESDFTKDDARHAVYLVDLFWDRMHLKQQEEALRVSERKYRQLTDNLTDVVWVTDLSLETIYVSPSIFALTGETPEEHLSTRLEDKLTPESIENVRRIMQEIQRQELLNPEDQQAYFRVEVEHYHKDGSRLWLEMHFSVLRDEQGKPTGIQGLSRNVTERKKSEAVILEQQRQLSSMIGNLPGFVYRCLDDEHWTMLFISESCTSITGYTPDELTQNSSTSFRAIIDPEALPEIEARWTRAREQKIPFECEYRILTKEGTWKWISERGICVFDDSGEILFLEGYIEDISQRKQNETFQHLLYKIARSSMTVKTLDELLLQLKTELGMLMDTRTFFVAIANDAGTQFKRILFTEDQCSEDVYPIKDSLAGYVLQTATALLLKGSDYLSFIEEHSILTYTDFPACWMGAPILIDEKARGVLVVKHARNAEAYDAASLRMLEMLAHELSIIMQRAKIIQALVAAKEKAEESDRLKTAFLANISHEIRTPMNGILGFMELLADPETGEGEREQYLKVMQKSGQRLLVTINDIIEVSKIESGQLEIHESALPLCDLMHYLQTFFAKQIRSEAIRLELRECPDETVHIDRYKLEAVLSNLINNAIKFTRKGQIEFGVRIEGNFLFFFVKDTGVGIPEEKIHRIF